MCGITGVINLYQPKPIPRETLYNMVGMIRHRGPDEFGIYRDEWAGLGSARLSIIDLSGGQQPICNEDGSLWIVYNGEVFNYLELRLTLENLGHKFKTNTDTEVILHLYEEYGPSCLNKLNGQFAFAIWNSHNRNFFLARDRMGIRPLHYAISESLLIFGSEVKSIFAHPEFQAQIDTDVLARIFTFWSAQPPATIFKGIRSLPPAHYLIFHDGKIETHSYWQLDFSNEMSSESDIKPVLEEFKSLLIDSTLIRLRADVPVGAYLSGGLDSSLTAAVIKKYTKSHLETFSIAFSDREFDESSYQLQMAKTLGTNHHVVLCNNFDIGEAFSEVIWHTETPILRTAPVPMYLLSKLVKENNFKVVLTGEGADELLGGYDIFKEMVVRRFWARDPESTLRPMLLSRLYPDITGLNHTGWAYLTAFFKKGLMDTQVPYYSHLLRWNNGQRLHRFLLPPPADTLETLIGEIPIPIGFHRWSPLAKAQFLEISTFLSTYLLSSQGDRMGMGHSVEGRYPFLDYRLVEFCSKLPSSWKLYGLTEKWFLRQFARELLPETIWKRVKRPYRAPIHRSFFSSEAPEYISDFLSEPYLKETGLFNLTAVSQLTRKAASGVVLSEVDDMAVAGILSTQLLYDQFVRNFNSRLTPVTDCDPVKIINRVSQEQVL